MKILKSVFAFTVFSFMMIIVPGCSFFGKVSVLEDKGSPNWKECGICHSYTIGRISTKSYQFSDENTSFAICPCAKPGIKIMVGPPLIPIIPNILALFPVNPNIRFFVDLQIDSHNPSTSIDLSKFQFRFFKDSIIKPSVIKLIPNKYYGEPEEFLYRNGKTKREFVDYNDSIINNPKIVVSKPLTFRFEFNMMTTKVKNLSIQFYPATGNNAINQIKYVKHNKLIYKPLFIN